MPIVTFTDYEQPDLVLETQLFEGHGWQLKDTVRETPCRTTAEVIAAASDAAAIICSYSPLTREVFDALPQLAIVSVPQVGLETIDLGAARDHGVWVANVPDGNVHEVAAHTLAMILALIRRLPDHDRLVRQGVWNYSAAGPLRRVGTLTLGLVGCGRIARLVAGHAASFLHNIIAYDPFVSDDAWPQGIERADTLPALLRRADVVSLHAPLTDETRGMINSESLKELKRGAYLVNVGRGALIDEAALVDALDRELLSGAALDVLQTEPPAADNPLLKDRRVILSPHAAFYSIESEQETRRRCVENILSLQKRGRPDDYVVEGHRRIA